tara:strand:- start:158 stop:361 length:204 start_codon:yes stop_codon:yes gene_type:complete
MGLLDKLRVDGSNLSKGNGATPSVPDFQQSKLHNTYSLNGDPRLEGKPAPSNLDLGDPVKYMDNLPR